MKSIAQWQKDIHQYAVEKGWWEKERNVGEMFLLFVSEVSEAFEEIRNGKAPAEVYFIGEKPEGVPIELADVVIRILDYCEHAGIDMEDAMRLKHAYNQTRPYRHGGKTA